jgi:hypothetical protein
MQLKVETTGAFEGDGAGVRSALPSDPGVEHGHHPKQDNDHRVCPGRFGASLAFGQFVAAPPRKCACGRAGRRESASEFPALGVGSGHHGGAPGVFVALAPLQYLVLVSPSAHDRAPKRASRHSLEGPPLPSRATDDQALRRHRCRCDRLRSNDSKLLGQKQSLRTQRVDSLLYAVATAPRWSHRIR